MQVPDFQRLVKAATYGVHPLCSNSAAVSKERDAPNCLLVPSQGPQTTAGVKVPHSQASILTRTYAPHAFSATCVICATHIVHFHVHDGSVVSVQTGVASATGHTPQPQHRILASTDGEQGFCYIYSPTSLSWHRRIRWLHTIDGDTEHFAADVLLRLSQHPNAAAFIHVPHSYRAVEAPGRCIGARRAVAFFDSGAKAPLPCLVHI
mmetsp:Transcript_9005/g.33169  ORF Transcript_9005/g.33169 Transcript_9005/m.33169 type:complete len:207 (-) Transcript_9005:966-1586(-)|eukprot:scaffold7246_cov410-Prasinococcus_capsulatus_cf.AAC.4